MYIAAAADEPEPEPVDKEDQAQSLSPSEVMEMSKNWSPEARSVAAAMIDDLVKGRRRAWYCASPGRACDGKPHKGYEYPHARSDQWPPLGEDWFAWFLSSGRGAGKTRTGAEYIRRISEKVNRIALIAPTSADARDTMIEGLLSSLGLSELSTPQKSPTAFVALSTP
jgi:hypothetical protein